MRETERRIQAYRAQLPHMRERVMVALSLLLVAAIMMVSASYAWVVLSINPEVKGIQTTLAANGNLEIALADGSTITVPADSLAGDGGKNLVAKNITWGNLVNLGDPSYGLENIVLRPAQLNTNKLLDSPLYAAQYGVDGRVELLDSDFAYAYWDQDIFTADPDKFHYGVRAISSVTYGQAPGQNLALADAVDKADKAMAVAQGSMRALAKNEAMQELVGLMASYIEAQIKEKLPGILGGGEEPIVHVSADQMESIYNLVVDLQECIEDAADALAAVYNVEMMRRTDTAYVTSNKFTGEFLLTATQADIQAKMNDKPHGEAVVQPSMLSYLWTLRTDYNQVIEDLAVLKTYVGRDDVVYRNLRGSTYPEIETYVNHVVNTGSTTINGVAIGSLSMDNISGLLGDDAKPIVINSGIIQRMDKFTGAKVETNDLKVTIDTGIMGTQNATGKATTSAVAPYVLPSEYNNALSGDTSYKGSNPIAGDTFGLAMDFWVRTNGVGTQLILQGSPVYETIEETATEVIDGTLYSLYLVPVEVEGETVDVVAFSKDGSYYVYDRENKTVGQELGATTDYTGVTVLKDSITKPVAYNGVNRVWDEEGNAYLDGHSTTMGDGSCYVFYPQTPEDQEKSLQLLQNLKIAFIDQSGTLLGEAVMDTTNVIEEPGKVTVPVICSITNKSYTDEDGNPVYYITELEENTPTFITALLYLDGQNLTNDQVLAAGDIQGSLNLQFGTSTDLKAMRDPILEQEKCVVTAEMEGPYTVTMDAPEADRTKTITISVDGYTPSTVTAYFQREINSTQGIRQRRMDFVSNGDGTFTQSYTFTSAGKYILREVILDGITYELDGDALEFVVEGFNVSDVYCEHNGKTLMLPDRSFTTNVRLNFYSDDVSQMPSTAKGAFIHSVTKDRTTVHFKRTTGSTWEGSATFLTSGEYHMEYLELDGEYTGLTEDNFITINLMLGLTASVYTGDTNFGMEDGEARDVPMTMLIRADDGSSIGNLTNVWLQYSNNGAGSQEAGVGAGMVWNSARKRYEGTFHIVDPGIYTFRYVSVRLGEDNNYLNRADAAPVITAISSAVPAYVSRDGFGEVFSTGDDAFFTLRFTNTDAATIDAKLVNERGAVSYVRGVLTEEVGNEQIYTFTLPIMEGKQSGTWTLEEIYMTNVYGGENNSLISAPTVNGPDVAMGDKPMYSVSADYYRNWWTWSLADITNEGETAPVVEVSNAMNIAFTASDVNKNKNFGKDADGNVNGLFGTNYALGSLELQVLAGTKALEDYGMTLTSVELEYRFNKDQSFSKVDNSTSRNNYGGYTVAVGSVDSMISGDRGTILYTLKSGEGGIYQLSTSNTGLSVAGLYEPVSMKLIVTRSNGTTVEMTASAAVLAGAPKYTVSSVVPTLTAKSISGSPTKKQNITYTYANNCTSNAPDFAVSTDNSTADSGVNKDTNTATLYATATADNSTQHNGTFSAPTLTVTVAGISSDATASFTVPAVGSAAAVTFSRTGSGDISNKIGTVSQIKSWTTAVVFTHKLQAYYGHGNKTISQLMVTGKDGVTVTFNLEKPLNIVNPSSVNQTN